MNNNDDIPTIDTTEIEQLIIEPSHVYETVIVGADGLLLIVELTVGILRDLLKPYLTEGLRSQSGDCQSSLGKGDRQRLVDERLLPRR